jgi:hypothetical protein
MREGSLQVCRSTDRDTASYILLYQKKEKVNGEILLISSLKKLITCCQQLCFVSVKMSY